MPWSPFNNYTDLPWIGSRRRSILLHCLACQPPCHNKKRARESEFLPSLLARWSNWSWGRWQRLSPGMAEPTTESRNGGLEARWSRPQHWHQREGWWPDGKWSTGLGGARQDCRKEGRDCCCVLAEGGVAWGLGEKGTEGRAAYLRSGDPKLWW